MSCPYADVSTIARCRISAPFGAPVVPEVYNMSATSSGVTSPVRSVTSAPMLQPLSRRDSQVITPCGHGPGPIPTTVRNSGKAEHRHLPGGPL